MNKVKIAILEAAEHSKIRVSKYFTPEQSKYLLKCNPRERVQYVIQSGKIEEINSRLRDCLNLMEALNYLAIGNNFNDMADMAARLNLNPNEVTLSYLSKMLIKTNLIKAINELRKSKNN